MDENAGRIQHYRDFYRPAGTPAPEDKPLWLVWGNCQAEALRRVLDAVPDRPFRTARIPPVHELESSDLGHLDDLLAHTAVLLSQPVRPGYRDLPLGTADIASRLPACADVVRWPVIRYSGLYPFQVIVRDPAAPSVDPPGVPYHDLRTVAAARATRSTSGCWDVEVAPDQLRAAASASIDELARRERRDCDVGVSDVLAGHGVDAAHAINHPGNPVFYDLVRRILGHLDVDQAISPITGPLLGSVFAPLERRVLDALALDGPVRRDWLFHGATLTADEVHHIQMVWYERNPEYVELTIARHGSTMRLLGLISGPNT
ncbi:WcbI family polysaccharide biosynthesis putative acetyltransferase [Mycobacterium deserti]|uniref:WcbI family polysaccharide biosynthesis putative acetyltransferase n=1 Tax=Mycobacterium deserti TaxID=2978347 RepID=A0ABT2MGJ9_9MYCO|nr:WcbI family polysaccharide biosynthesis putative acetyltransferase [Mycobacterium deserti]MCT7661106.1 WcbI family polysaccharide biosynthesis putative acetyltransferase [Mycobacterium deserti]